MARTPAGSALTQRHRTAQLAVRADVLRDLTRLWRVVDPADLSGTIGRFVDAATALIRARHRDSAGLAAAYFAAFRFAEGLPGEVARALVDPPPAEVVARTVRGAGLAGIVDARRAGRPATVAARNGMVRMVGAAGALVLAGGRRTIVESIRADRRAQGWQRVTSGGPCAFCAMVASRGAVFKTERAARFQAHDHCACQAEPLYTGSAPLPANEQLRQRWNETTAGLSGTDALNAFRRDLEGRAAPPQPAGE